MHRNGKIARLPKELRDIVNRMLDDGANYRSIIIELEKHRHQWPPELADITEDNISNWRAGGYIDYQRDQAVEAELRARREFAITLPDNAEDLRLHEVVLQLGVSNLYHVLAGFNHTAIEAKLADDPKSYSRLINALGRLSRDALDLQKYKDHVRERKERIQAELNKVKKPGGISKEALERIERELNLL